MLDGNDLPHSEERNHSHDCRQPKRGCEASVLTDERTDRNTEDVRECKTTKNERNGDTALRDRYAIACDDHCERDQDTGQDGCQDAGGEQYFVTWSKTTGKVQ